MATTIQTFFTQAATKQFARDFLFRVKQINLAGGIQFDGEKELVYARTATLPGRAIENKPVNYFGLQFNVPGKATYTGSESYSIEFYHDEKVELRTKLEAASRVVFNDVSSTGEYGMPGRGNIISLEVIDRKLVPVRLIDLIGVSIRDISPIDYAIADGTGEVKNFTVTFAYHFYDDFANLLHSNN